MESEIVDRKVTRCGREMGTIPDTELAWTEAPSPAERCYVCDRGR